MARAGQRWKKAVPAWLWQPWTLTPRNPGSLVLHFSDAVNVTLGLPIIRTSADQATAYDIAGQDMADPSSLKATIRMAVDIAENRARSVSNVKSERRCLKLKAPGLIASGAEQFSDASEMWRPHTDNCIPIF